jgi:hypothetical protein
MSTCLRTLRFAFLTVSLLFLSFVPTRAQQIQSRALKKQKPAPVIYLVIVGAFLSTQFPAIARADSASCLARLSVYVAELDQLLLKEKNWIRPFKDLNQKHFPLRDCEVNALLDEVRRSRFLQTKSYDANTIRYFFVFSNGDVEAGFTYLASDRKSEFDFAMFTRK